MATSLELFFSPAEFATLKQRDLSRSVCVVFDILRATSSMMMALSNGAEAILPVSEIPAALALREKNPEFLLAGEREGLRIRAAQTGGVDFDLGNSPREFVPEKVRGKTIVMTTTNGTRALQACAGAQQIFIGSFLSLRPLANWIAENRPENLILVCSGTFEEAALEDTLAAGALCKEIWPHYSDGAIADSAQIARQIFVSMEADLPGAIKFARNGRRLLANPDLRDDVAICVQRETLNFIAECKNGRVRRRD